MPMHRFQVSDPAAFLEIAELIFRSSRAGESVAIELPLKGCAGALTNWQTEQARLFRKMDLPPDIHVSVNRSGGDQIVVRTEREVIMNRTIIKNILESLVPIERIKQWILNESAADEQMPVDNANTGAPLNILYSAFGIVWWLIISMSNRWMPEMTSQTVSEASLSGRRQRTLCNLS